MSKPVISQASSPKAGSRHLEEAGNVEKGVNSISSDMSEATLVPKWEPLASLTLPGEKLGLKSGPGENLANDGEIDVFDAAEYFKEGLNASPGVGELEEFHDLDKDNDHKEVYAAKQVSPMVAMGICPGSRSNSRGWLLQTRKAGKGKILGAICCKISCTDKNSVDYAAENCTKRSEEPVLHQAGKTRDYVEGPIKKVNSSGCLSVPFLSPNISNQIEPGAAKTAQLKQWSSIMENGRSNSKERTAIPLKGQQEIRKVLIHTETYIADESDGSSDLFEIESISKEIPLKLQNESDGFPGGVITPANCYPPSEASIDWSVVTASAAEFSVVSNSEKLEPSTVRCPPPPRPVVKPKTSSETSKFRPRILSTCNTQKAVGVVGDAHIANELRNSQGRR